MNKKLLSINEIFNEGNLVILILDKIDFKNEITTEDKEGHFIVINVYIKYIAILNLYMLNLWNENTWKFTELLKEIKFTIIMSDYDISLNDWFLKTAIKLVKL